MNENDINSKRLLSDRFYREDGTIRDYKTVTNTSGDEVFVKETHYLPPQKVKVQWYTIDGVEVDESYNGDVTSYMFQVFAEGIATELIESVEFPKLTYVSKDDYLVKIIVNVLVD